jgi:hypothetical protein
MVAISAMCKCFLVLLGTPEFISRPLRSAQEHRRTFASVDDALSDRLLRRSQLFERMKDRPAAVPATDAVLVYCMVRMAL